MFCFKVNYLGWLSIASCNVWCAWAGDWLLTRIDRHGVRHSTCETPDHLFSTSSLLPSYQATAAMIVSNNAHFTLSYVRMPGCFVGQKQHTILCILIAKAPWSSSSRDMLFVQNHQQTLSSCEWLLMQSPATRAAIWLVDALHSAPTRDETWR